MKRIILIIGLIILLGCAKPQTIYKFIFKSYPGSIIYITPIENSYIVVLPNKEIHFIKIDRQFVPTYTYNYIFDPNKLIAIKESNNVMHQTGNAPTAD